MQIAAHLGLPLLVGSIGFYGCAAHTGQDLNNAPVYENRTDLRSRTLLKVPFFPDKTDQCGPSTLASLLSFWGKQVNPIQLRQEMYLAKLHGTLPIDFLITAQNHGLKADMVQGDIPTLHRELSAGHPVIVMLNTGFSAIPVDHYIVVTGFDDDRKGLFAHSAGTENKFISYKAFLREWEMTDYWTLMARPST